LFVELKSELFHEIPEVASWNLGIMSELLGGRGKSRKLLSRWSVAGISGYIPTSREQNRRVDVL
jgi:hypothetical protein